MTRHAADPVPYCEMDGSCSEFKNGTGAFDARAPQTATDEDGFFFSARTPRGLMRSAGATRPAAGASSTACATPSATRFSPPTSRASVLGLSLALGAAEAQEVRHIALGPNLCRSMSHLTRRRTSRPARRRARSPPRAKPLPARRRLWRPPARIRLAPASPPRPRLPRAPPNSPRTPSMRRWRASPIGRTSTPRRRAARPARGRRRLARVAVRAPAHSRMAGLNGSLYESGCPTSSGWSFCAPAMRQ